MVDVLDGKCNGLLLNNKQIVRHSKVKIMGRYYNNNKLVVFVNDNAIIRMIRLAIPDKVYMTNIIDSLITIPNMDVEVLELSNRVIDFGLYSSMVDSYDSVMKSIEDGYSIEKDKFDHWLDNAIITWYNAYDRSEHNNWLLEIKNIKKRLGK